MAVNATYTWETEHGSLSPSVSYIWRDKQFGSIFERFYNESPSWSQVDARVTWKDKDNKYSVIAYVKNMFDTLGYDGGSVGARLAGTNIGPSIASPQINLAFSRASASPTRSPRPAPSAWNCSTASRTAAFGSGGASARARPLFL